MWGAAATVLREAEASDSPGTCGPHTSGSVKWSTADGQRVSAVNYKSVCVKKFRWSSVAALDEVFWPVYLYERAFGTVDALTRRGERGGGRAPELRCRCQSPFRPGRPVTAAGRARRREAATRGGLRVAARTPLVRRLSLLWTDEAGGCVYTSGTDSEGEKHETCCTTATSKRPHTTDYL